MEKKSVVLAVVLNVVIVGAGHVYVGCWGKGIMFFVGAVILASFTAGFGAFLPMFFAVRDVYNYTNKLNAGVTPETLKKSWGGDYSDID